MGPRLRELTIQLTQKVKTVRRLSPDQPWPEMQALVAPAGPPPSPISDPVALALQQLRAERLLLERLLERVSEQITHAASHRQQHLHEWQQATVELAIAIAERVLRQRLDAEAQSLEPLIRQMASEFRPNSELTICMNPHDLRLIKSDPGVREWLDKRAATTHWVEDATLPRGDCHVHDGEQSLLARLSTQLDSIRDDLNRSLRDAAA